MAVKFKLMGRKNPQDLQAPEKYYATAMPDGEVDMEYLAEMISEQCTVTDTDCLAVLSTLEKNIIRELKQGRIVKLGHLGNFRIGISAIGQDTIEDVSALDIHKTRVLFAPGKKMRKMLGELTFRKAG